MMPLHQWAVTLITLVEYWERENLSGRELYLGKVNGSVMRKAEVTMEIRLLPTLLSLAPNALQAPPVDMTLVIPSSDFQHTSPSEKHCCSAMSQLAKVLAGNFSSCTVSWMVVVVVVFVIVVVVNAALGCRRERQQSDQCFSMTREESRFSGYEESKSLGPISST
jgi:hypothetical protein